MATYRISIHDVRRLLRQTKDTADCRPLDSESDRSDYDNHQEKDTTDSWSLDADSDQVDLDDKEETKVEEPNRQKVVGHQESCSGIQTKRQRHLRIDSLGERDYRPSQEGS
jgi:hypothetical protein